MIAVIVWALELTGIPRDWFYRSSIYVVIGGTVFTAVFAALAVVGQPQGETTNPVKAFWTGRIREASRCSSPGNVTTPSSVRRSTVPRSGPSTGHG